MSVEKADGQPKPINRLHDMETEEVSLVDRAANKRTFIVTKRSDGMSESTQGTELQPDGKGGFTASATTSAASPSFAAVEPPKPADAAPVATDKANSGATLEEAVNRLMSVANKVKAGEDPGKLAGEIKAITTMLAAVTEKYPSPTTKDEVPVAPTTTTEPPASVEKAGRRMAKERLERYKAAVKMLSDLLSELEPGDGLADPAAPATPTAGAAQVGKADESASIPVVVTVDPQVAAVVKAVGDLTAIVKKQGETLDRVTKTAPASAQIPVEPKRLAPGVPEGDVSWPLDMNRDLGRDSVAKDVSFHDP